MALEDLKTVTVELTYEDALRLWVLVHDPRDAGRTDADRRIRKIVHDAIGVTEDDYASHRKQVPGA
jgi:hypothetical protein